MRTLPALVIAGPGTNRDADAAFALGLAGADPRTVLVSELVDDPGLLHHARLVVVAGGFSYADSLGAGRMMALDLVVALGDALREFVADGKPIVGICNGFQVLTGAGLLPGSLAHNDTGRFDCRWVSLDAHPASKSVWTSGLDGPIDCPIAHGEGRYVHPDVSRLEADGQVALRYRANPNGSVADIAGVCDETGVVLGLMPHPENHVVARQHPLHRRSTTEPTSGLRLFRNGVTYAAES